MPATKSAAGKKSGIRSLKSQLVISYVAICVFVLALSTLLCYFVVFGIVRDMSERSTLESFRQVEANVNGFVDEIDSFSKVFITNQSIQDLLDGKFGSPADKINLFTEFQRNFSRTTIAYPYIKSIFIFTNDGNVYGASDTNNWYLSGDAENTDYDLARARALVGRTLPHISVLGGFADTDFMTKKQRETSRGTLHYVTAVKGIKSLNQSRQSAALLVNISEDKLNAIYGKLSGSGVAYITDREGTVISHPDPARIGTRSGAADKIDFSVSEGSFTATVGGASLQIIHYSLGKTGWVLVKEIPTDEFSESLGSLKNVFILSFLVSLLIIFVLYLYWINKLTAPLSALTKAIVKVGMGDIGRTVPSVPANELGMLIDRFNAMSLSVKEMVEKNRMMEEQKRELEVEMLQSRINPHFLYNTLNVIRWLAAVINAKNIVRCVTALGNLLRPVFSERGALCTVREEADYLKNYIEIMSFRYDDDVRFELDIGEECMDCRVLRFILQPLVENSLVHGFSSGAGGKEIRVCARIEGDALEIEVADNGDGIPAERAEELNRALRRPSPEAFLREQGTGLKNVARRIRLHFGEQYGASVRPGPRGGTVAALRLPVVRQETPGGEKVQQG